MLRDTVAVWLSEHGPCTSSQLRTKVGLTVKGTPIASRLGGLVNSGYATVKKNKSKVAVFTLTAKGKTTIPEILNNVERIEDINSRDYVKGVSTTRPMKKANLDPTSEKAMNSFVELLDRNRKADQLIRAIMVQCQTYLEQGAEDEQIS